MSDLEKTINEGTPVQFSTSHAFAGRRIKGRTLEEGRSMFTVIYRGRVH